MLEILHGKRTPVDFVYPGLRSPENSDKTLHRTHLNTHIKSKFLPKSRKKHHGTLVCYVNSGPRRRRRKDGDSTHKGKPESSGSDSESHGGKESREAQCPPSLVRNGFEVFRFSFL